MKWEILPIEEAPKDRDILAWWPYPGMWETTSWDEEKYAKKPQPHWRSNTIAAILGMKVMRDKQPTKFVLLPPDQEES